MATLPQAFFSDNGIELTRESPLPESKDELLPNLLSRRRGMSAKHQGGETQLLPPCRGCAKADRRSSVWRRPPCGGKVGIGVEITIISAFGFYPHPTPPPAWGREQCGIAGAYLTELTGAAPGRCGYDFGHEFKTSATMKRMMKTIATKHSTVVSRMYLQSPFSASNSAVKF